MKKLEVKSYKKFYKVNDQWIEEQMQISPKQHKTLKLTDQNVINSISSDTPVTDDTTIANFLVITQKVSIKSKLTLLVKIL
jgi:hypothetical protein